MTIDELRDRVVQGCAAEQIERAKAVFKEWLAPNLGEEVNAVGTVLVEQRNHEGNLALIFMVRLGMTERAWLIINRLTTAGLSFQRVGTYQQAFTTDRIEISFGF